MNLLRKKHQLKNYDFCLGMGVNWVDMDRGVMYHIQDYKEALNKGEHPTKIKVTKLGTKEEVEWVDPIIIQERMKDPEPDPRY